MYYKMTPRINILTSGVILLVTGLVISLLDFLNEISTGIILVGLWMYIFFDNEFIEDEIKGNKVKGQWD